MSRRVVLIRDYGLLRAVYSSDDESAESSPCFRLLAAVAVMFCLSVCQLGTGKLEENDGGISSSASSFSSSSSSFDLSSLSNKHIKINHRSN